MNAQRPNRNQARELAREKAREMRLAGNSRESVIAFCPTWTRSVGTCGHRCIGCRHPHCVQASWSWTAQHAERRNQDQDRERRSDDSRKSCPTQALWRVLQTLPELSTSRCTLTTCAQFAGQFEVANKPAIEDLLARGAATIEIHPIAILTNRSQGTQYSLRAANAAACVANDYPNSFMNFHNTLLITSRWRTSPGWTDEELIGFATQSGAGPEVESCMQRPAIQGLGKGEHGTRN